MNFLKKYNFRDYFKRDLAIDLGTANTLIIEKGEVIVNEPSIVAIDPLTNKVIEVGSKAMLMHEKTHSRIRTLRPLKDGVIADFEAAEQMIREMIKMTVKKKFFFPPNINAVICIPSGITEVEKRAVVDSAEHAGAKQVALIHEPMAAALGMGIDVLAPEGNMVVDIGGGTTDVAIIALGGIITNKSIRVAGDDFTSDIVNYMRKEYNLLIGERSAEKIKITIGSALSQLDIDVLDYEVRGRNLITGTPKQVKITYQEVSHAIDKSISKIEQAILSALETSPPEISADIYKTGIFLAGGGALIKGLDHRISMKTKLPVYVGKDPLKAVAIGTGLALKNSEIYPFLIK